MKPADQPVVRNEGDGDPYVMHRMTQLPTRRMRTPLLCTTVFRPAFAAGRKSGAHA